MADVAVELAVVKVAGVADGGAPHLAGGIGIAAEDCQAGWTADGREHAVARAVIGPGNAVRLQNRIADALLYEQAVHSGIVAAFGEPKALRFAAEKLLVMPHAHADLRPHRRFVYGEQRQIAMGGRTPDHLDFAGLLKALEAVHEIFVVARHERFAHLKQQIVIHAGERMKAR